MQSVSKFSLRQSVSIVSIVTTDQVAMQSSRCKLSVGNKNANSCVFIY